MVTSNIAESGKFFTFQFQTNPFDQSDGNKKIADQLLVLKSSGITFFYDNEVARDISNFFTMPEQLADDIKQTLNDEYVQRFEQSRTGLAHIISTRNTFLIDIDFQAPKIIIPGKDIKRHDIMRWLWYGTFLGSSFLFPIFRPKNPQSPRFFRIRKISKKRFFTFFF